MNLHNEKLGDLDLPDGVKQYIRDLRQESARLRAQIRDHGMQVTPQVELLPVKARNEIGRLRAEAGRYRTQLRDVQAQLAQLREQLSR